MSSLIKQVFYYIAIATASMLLYLVAFGDIGQNFFWDAIRPVSENNWKAYTGNDGMLLKHTLDVTFDNVVDLSTN